MNVFRRLISTDGSASTFILRLALGIVFFPHGAQKTLGWFGGTGFHMSLAGMSSELPLIVAFLVIMAESLGSLGLIVGFLSRIAALGIFCVMVGAIALLHWQSGFFMNWMDTPGKHEGFEYHLLAIGIALALLIRGGGAFSIDGWLFRKTAWDEFERINITQSV
jgi:putative oxidoreductase